MKRTRLCDAVCRALFDLPDLDAVTFDLVDNHPTLRRKIRDHSSPQYCRAGAEAMSVLSRTPGLLVKSRTSPDAYGMIVVRPPWPIMGRDAIAPPDDAVKCEADFHVVNRRRGQLIETSYSRALHGWELRQKTWMDAACEAWVDKTCSHHHPLLEEILQ